MTDYKQLCTELIDALDSGIPSARIRSSSLADQARAALAEPEPEDDVDSILRLAEIIREVDGSHNLGAAALAEAILSHPNSRWGK